MEIIVLAAGQSKRFASNKHKALHKLFGRTMLYWVTRSLLPLNPHRVTFVLGHQAQAIQTELQAQFDFEFHYAYQEQQLGTAHALQTALQASSAIDSENSSGILLTCVDTPALTSQTLQELITHTESQQAKMGVLSSTVEQATGYGRMIRDPHTQTLTQIIEEKDCTTSQKQIREINAGVYYFAMSRAELEQSLSHIDNRNAQGEYYLTDLVSVLRAQTQKAVAYQCTEAFEVQGINDKSQLVALQRVWNAHNIQKLSQQGVIFHDAASCLVAPSVSISNDTVIEPHCQILGDTSIGLDCQIGSHSYLDNARISDQVQIKHSHVVDSQIASHCRIGPFANLRAGTVLQEQVTIGDFVEIKNSTLGTGTAASHLSYLGDATIGTNVNIGAGTITANFEAISATKHHSFIGNDVKIGSNSVLVAPVQIADRCMLGAATILRGDVSETDSLVVSKAPLICKAGWVKQQREKFQQMQMNKI